MINMTTTTDSQFASRFSGLSASTYVANQSTLSGFTPTTSLINTGMLSDIGRATIYGPDLQDNFFSKFMKSPLSRGDSAMTARMGEISSYAYSPTAADTVLFGASNPTMTSNVAKKNLTRQVAVELNDRYIKQMSQTEEMIGDVSSAIMASSNACYLDDMWVASKEYFSGSTRSGLAGQYAILTNDPTDDGFGAEMTEVLWQFSQKKFGYKSALYNASGVNTKSTDVAVAMTKDCEYPTFKKLLSETFNPEMLNIAINGGIDYVDSFATPAGKPETAGDLLGIVVDTRAYEITPMPDALQVESFRNPARKSTAYFTTYEYAFQDNPFFNKAFIYGPAA
jgi:hypothetical protein